MHPMTVHKFKVGDTVQGYARKPTGIFGTVIQRKKLGTKTQIKVRWKNNGVIVEGWHSPISLLHVEV